ncbi:DNA/RNA polymerase [Ramaria rubella]|nr:DNA/RNA polymerase [Ramaria rubella]
MLTSTCKKSVRCLDATFFFPSYIRTRTDHSQPRVVRRYSSASKIVEAAVSLQTTPIRDLPPPFVPAVNSELFPLTGKSLTSFLRRGTPLTILPIPLPTDSTSNHINDFFFPDSHSQDLLAIIDTCLNECYDVPRARDVFESMRIQGRGDFMLKIPIFNKFLQAYGTMAAKHEQHRGEWVQEAWLLFNRMEAGDEKAVPNAETYATMVLLCKRHDPSFDPAVSIDVTSRSPVELLRMAIARDIPLISLVPASRVVSDNEVEQDELLRLISRTVASMGYPKLLHEFGQAAEGADVVDAPDHLQDVPTIKPVVRLRPRRQVENEVRFEEDGSVLEVPAEGDGSEEVYEVPYNLRKLRANLNKLNATHKTLGDDLWARQQLLEQSVYDIAVERLKHEHDNLDKLQLSTPLGGKPLRALMWDWHQKLTKRLEDDIGVLVKEETQTTTTGRGIQFLRLGSFVSLLKPEKLSLIVILELINLQGTGGIDDGMKIARALLTVGRAVEDEYKAELSRRYHIPIPAYTPGSIPRSSYFSPMGYDILYERRVAARQELENAEHYQAPWTQQIRLKVGSFLVDCLMDVATIERHTIDRRTGEQYSEHQPAFVHAYEYLRGHKLGVIKLNPAVASRLSRDTVTETVHPRQLPMLTKPRPWVGVEDGGYLTTKTSAMRYKDAIEQFVYLRQASDQGKLELIYAGLDVLGTTPWCINENIFDVVVQVWNSGERLLKIPPVAYEVPEPAPPPDYESDARAKSIHMQRVKEWAHAKANCHSERCNVNYKLEIARAFLNETFYFPHNLDFRGRAYPVPPHLNHIGDDLSRGLLRFGESKPLGQSGLRWLKIHLSNLYGFDKASFSERVEFAMAHLDDIYDSAEKPLNGRRWWMKADDPWQCLATCIELRSALESHDPLKFESTLPVHQDGTCNGLQHYAALGGDRQGAAQVNLSVTDRPSDVYTFVANMLDATIARDVAKGVEEAKMIQGKITRKVVKQTVMTTVYGVTFIGARDQIERQLREKTDIPTEARFKISSYVAKQTLAAIGDLFNGARAIQNWFTLSARLIAKSIPQERLQDAMGFTPAVRTRGRLPKKIKSDRIGKEQMSSVIWTTALGLPIVQPYRKVKRQQIMTKIQSVFISDPNAPSEVNATKQATAFPPNFVHSLDATHMMLTALECRTEGITFAAVHDSYWTHASTIDRMSTHIRDTFIELHSSDVLRRLEEEFRSRYATHKIPVRALFHGKLIERLRAAGTKFVVPKEVEEQVLNEIAAEEDDALPLVDDSDADPDEVCRPKKRAVTEQSFNVKFVTDDDDGLRGRFVDFVDLLPPLPEKGDFEVSTIKNSEYFFS